MSLTGDMPERMSRSTIVPIPLSPAQREAERRAAVIEACNLSLAPGAPVVELPCPFGTKVHIDGDTSIKGTVTGIIFYPHGMQIEVAWFANGDAKSGWFGEARVSRA